jgi:hypothetical protein
MNQHEIQNQAFKVGSAWALIGITSWAELGAFLGAIYSALLICEWLWKKAVKPMLIARGYIAATAQVAVDE